MAGEPERPPPPPPEPEWQPEEAPPDPERKGYFKTPPTLGTFLGIGGMVLFLLAASLPWYNVSGLFPAAGYSEWTTLIQFDGVRGLYVLPELRERLGFQMPSFFFPFVLLLVFTFLLRLRRLRNAKTPAERGKSFLKGTIGIVLPIAVAVLVISQIPNFIPPDADPEVSRLGQEIGTHPFGGEAQFTFPGPINGTAVTGDLRWGFGPALTVMAAAAGLLVFAAIIEYGAGRREKER